MLPLTLLGTEPWTPPASGNAFVILEQGLAWSREHFRAQDGTVVRAQAPSL